MKNPRIPLALRLALTAWSLVALLPPGAWALCLGEQGHVALEPTGTSCSPEATPGPQASSCSATNCETCVDLPLLPGVLIQQARPRLDAPDAAPCHAPPAFAMPELSLHGHSPARPGRDPNALSSSRSSTILRC